MAERLVEAPADAKQDDLDECERLALRAKAAERKLAEAERVRLEHARRSLEYPDTVVDLAWEMSLPTETLSGALAARGLHVVTDVDMAVLEAMGKLPLRCLESVRDGDSALHPMVHPPLLAELARREAKHGQ